MRVKIGDAWHGVDRDRPIMIEVSDADRRNIAGMTPGARFYAVFHDSDEASAASRLAWMKQS